ncbi:MAG: permease [Acidimicrobiia bacterium]|nr:permease [Acidimicrobiia bacterium]
MTDLLHSLREAFFMLWETLWALVLGFALSGAVQAFVPRESMERALGDHRPPAVARASFFGMVSSSCSYAASAMARSLYEKGADFLTAMAFMFASTNLVVELGVVLLVLLGWQFAAAEFVGGVLMIVLLVTLGGFVLTRRATDRARAHLADANLAHERVHGHDHCHDAPTSAAGWAEAAAYTMADIKMLRRELVIGCVVAGLLAVVVPTAAWNDLFLTGHGFWTTVQNVVIGPFIALISFVCSIGNVPLAAALWRGGISFGGVISFVFADLIAFPLVLVYRRFYGTRVAIRLTLTFWATMSVAGLVVQGLFQLLGAVPRSRPKQIVATHFAWNYTTFLNIVFLGVFAVLYRLSRTRDEVPVTP